MIKSCTLFIILYALSNLAYADCHFSVQRISGSADWDQSTQTCEVVESGYGVVNKINNQALCQKYCVSRQTEVMQNQLLPNCVDLNMCPTESAAAPATESAVTQSVDQE